MTTRKFHRKNRAFTLIELLVVISIIALLLSVLVPSLSKAKKSAQLVLCRNNLHQWAVAIGAFAADNEGNAPLSTTYEIDGAKVTASFPNEMYLDQYTGQLNPFGSSEKQWQKKMISHESMAPYLPGFNEKGLRYADRGTFLDHEDNFQLEGVWKCPSQKKREIEFIMGQLTGMYGSRAFFRVDYSFLGRSDLWADSMFPELKDRSTVTGKFPASGRVMMTDTVFWWNRGTVWYNHGSEGPSYEASSGDTDNLKAPKFITGLNYAFGDGSVEWLKMDSTDRFQIVDDQFEEDNRHINLGIGTAKLYY